MSRCKDQMSNSTKAQLANARYLAAIAIAIVNHTTNVKGK